MNDAGLIERWCAKRGLTLTARGRAVAENLEGTVIVLGFLLVLAVAGGIETGRWF